MGLGTKFNGQVFILSYTAVIEHAFFFCTGYRPFWFLNYIESLGWSVTCIQIQQYTQWYHLTCFQARIACLKRAMWCTPSAFASFSSTLTTVVLLQDWKAPRSSWWSWNSPALCSCSFICCTNFLHGSVPCSSSELAHSASLPWLWTQLAAAASAGAPILAVEGDKPFQFNWRSHP